MKHRRPRGLDPEERALWERVAGTARPLAAKSEARRDRTGPAPPAAAPDASEKPPLPRFEIGAKAQTAVPAQRTPRQQEPLRMDRKVFQRMKRGKERPEARLDLHGMTVAAAQGALTAFILSSHAAGRRLVLVITGKGREREDDGPIPARSGVLRRHVPGWLASPPLSAVVLQVTEAHRRHGGAGAFYVYLRRR